MDFFLVVLPHFLGIVTHFIFLSPWGEVLFIPLSFLVGRFSGGIGLFLRVSLLIIEMARHFYQTHPRAVKKKGTTKIDNIFDKLYKEEVLTAIHMPKEGHETGAKG